MEAYVFIYFVPILLFPDAFKFSVRETQASVAVKRSFQKTETAGGGSPLFQSLPQ